MLHFASASLQKAQISADFMDNLLLCIYIFIQTIDTLGFNSNAKVIVIWMFSASVVTLPMWKPTHTHKQVHHRYIMDFVELCLSPSLYHYMSGFNKKLLLS